MDYSKYTVYEALGSITVLFYITSWVRLITFFFLYSVTIVTIPVREL